MSFETWALVSNILQRIENAILTARGRSSVPRESVHPGEIPGTLYARQGYRALLATGQGVEWLEVRGNQLAIAGGEEVEEQPVTSVRLNSDGAHLRDCMH